MPDHEPDYFGVVCDADALDQHLAACRASGFRVEPEPNTGATRVYDGPTLVIRAERFGGGWMARLHAAYYRHPFAVCGGGDAMPGVP